MTNAFYEEQEHDHSEICKELNEIFKKKNRDYGDSFHRTFTEEGMATARIRLSDKFYRFKNLTLATNSAVAYCDDESVRDTLLDLANYAILTVIELDALNHGQSV